MIARCSLEGIDGKQETLLQYLFFARLFNLGFGVANPAVSASLAILASLTVAGLGVAMLHRGYSAPGAGVEELLPTDS